MTPDAIFLSQAYQDVLGRPIDQGGLNYFTNILEQPGATRTQVATTLLGSSEYLSREVKLLYLELLHRPADPGGLTFFQSRLSSGSTPEQVTAIIAGSPEYFQLHGANNSGFLSALYTDLLQRPIDSGGQAYFTRALATGQSRTQVATAVLGSTEYLTDLVENLYNQYLHRSADAAGLAFSLHALRSGATDAQIVTNLITSDEYAPGNLTADQAQQLLNRAAVSTKYNNAVIAVVDRNGTLLGVQIEAGLSPKILSDTILKTFAIDGALAEARTGAYFATNAPLTSRTVQFISQSTMTQREVMSNPDIANQSSTFYGPGFVAPVEIGGHFPPNVANTPTVDLDNIEATNRDSILHPDANGNKTITLPSEFNVPTQYIPAGQTTVAPESYGLLSGILPTAQARGLGTLPGGIPIYMDGRVVGGIGVFFPGTTGYATEENSSLSATFNPNLPDLSLVAEYMAFAAVGGSPGAGFSVGSVAGVKNVSGIQSEPFGQINLGGVELPLFGPGVGAQAVDALFHFGQSLGTRSTAGDTNPPVDLASDAFIGGNYVPSGWLVKPHDGTGLTAADVVQIITQGINQANQTRSAIRLPPEMATMVLSVSDKDGNLLGLYRMPDSTIFSIDVAVAKSRNTTYYANPSQLQPQDQVAGLPAGVAMSSRTFRYLALPTFPEGVNGTPPAPFSILNDPGTDPQTGLNTGAAVPANQIQSVEGYTSFHPGTNFHDPGNIANQNGVIFFPGGVPLFKTVNGSQVLVGGLGVSGDGVDQDDVVTYAASAGFNAPANLTADNFFVRGVRLPYVEFDRNPGG
jgi:uncharacterized protein GlcG (DUF336 family)